MAAPGEGRGHSDLQPKQGLGTLPSPHRVTGFTGSSPDSGAKVTRFGT